MSGIIGWISLGILLAIFVRLILRLKDPDGMLVTLLLGTVGSLLGGFLAVVSGVIEYGDRTGLFAALAGAVTALTLKALAVRYESTHR